VPGSPLDPRCRGSNDLLRHGATLTETAEDIVQQLGPGLQGGVPGPATTARRVLPERIAPLPLLPEPAAGDPDADNAMALIVERLGPSPVPVDELVRQCQLSAAAVATLLLELELAGRIERHPGNLVSLR
jgi:DNA processing protein